MVVHASCRAVTACQWRWCLPHCAWGPYSHAHLAACRGRNAREYEHTGPGERLVSVQFAWGAEVKDVSSIWVGTSPEFELALYTLVRAPPLAASLLLWGHSAIRACLALHAWRRSAMLQAV